MKLDDSVKVISSQTVAAPVYAAKTRLRLRLVRDWLSDRMSAVRQCYLQMFGIPDYERYAAYGARSSRRPAAVTLPLFRQVDCSEALRLRPAMLLGRI